MRHPDTIGRYRIEGVLGAGTFATVFKGRDEALDVPVAVKVLGQNWSYEPEIRTRFVTEARLLRRADGTRVVRVHDIGQTPEGQPYFVMDLADRGTVEDRLVQLAAEGRALTVEDVGRFVRLLAAGVAEVHRLGVVHRDLKPSNLLLHSDPAMPLDGPADGVGGGLVRLDERLVVSDLGLARDLLGPTRLTAVVGTPGYMAPEQRDPAARLDARADVYACTAILHTVLCGAPPGEPGDPATGTEGAPEAVRRLLAHGLAADPAHRFATIEEWHEAAAASLDSAGAGWTAPPHSAPLVRAMSSLGRSTPRPSRPRSATPVPVSLAPGSEPGHRRRGRRWAAPLAAVGAVAIALGAWAVLPGDDDGQVTGGDDGGTPASTPVQLPGVDGVAASEGSLFDPIDVATLADGSVVVVELAANRVRRIAPDGSMTTVAGTGRVGGAGDGGAATAAETDGPLGTSGTADGGFLLADYGNGRVRRVAADGTITTVAGSGASGSPQVGAPAVDQPIAPVDVAEAADGSIYVTDSTADVVWRIGPDGQLDVFAGGGDTDADGVPATEATFQYPSSLVVAPDGTVFISDPAAAVVRAVAPDGTIRTVAGTGEAAFSGDGGPATAAAFAGPDGLALGGDGTLFIADTVNRRIRAVAPDGTVTTVAGNGDTGLSGDGGPAVDATLAGPAGVAVLPDGSLAIADTGNNRVRVVAPDGTIDGLAGANAPGTAGDNSPATEAPIFDPTGLAFDPEGRLVFAESYGGRIRRVESDGTLVTIAGNGLADVRPVGPALEAQITTPAGIVYDPLGNLYLVEDIGNAVRGITPDGTIVDLAGTGAAGFGGDGGPGAAAVFSGPKGIAAGDAELYVADYANNRIRVLTADAEGATTVATAAGSGQFTTAGQAAPTGPIGALEAELYLPWGVAVGADGTVYLSEQFGHRVRALRADGTLEVVAGTGEAGFAGDGGPATGARLDGPAGLAVGPDGTVYVAELTGNRVRAIAPDGTIRTVAGTGEAGYSGDGGAGTDATLDAPSFVAVGPDGAVYVSDTGNDRIRRIDADGTITTVAGAF